MTTSVQHKPVPKDVSRQILDQMEATFGKWERRGYCPCCVARLLLMHAGLFAAHELQPEDMREALSYVAGLSEKYGPPPHGAVRH